jgi:hypothetical protein
VYDYDTDTYLNAGPGAAKVWAYNLLAPTSADMPAIIIKISGVVVDGTPWPGMHFLTIENFYRNPGRILIEELEQSKVYTIADVEFDESDLTPVPYTKTKNVLVKITMLEWESEEVDYDL